jgi:hypothetical protein
LLFAGLCLAPVLLLGIAAVSYLTIDRDVRVIREHVMAATGARWATRLQMNVGRLTLGAIGEGLRFSAIENVDTARLALDAVRGASVGIYAREANGGRIPLEKLFLATDRAMQNRGWTRLVGVAKSTEQVLVYVPSRPDERGPIDVCVAVVSGKELVVASARLNPEALQFLLAKHSGGGDDRRFRLAKPVF